jgi:ABC-type uncharacterized transport system permease subunit
VTGLLYALRAFFGVGIREAFSYPLMMLDRVINLSAVTILLFYGGRLLSPENTTVALPADYFLYGMTGYAVIQVFNAGLVGFRFRVRQFQLHGLLEACVMTRTKLWQILLTAPAYEFVTSLARSAMLFGLALLVARQTVPIGGTLKALAVLALGTSSFLCLGFISACGVLVLKRGEPLTRGISLATMLFSGAFFPRELLPDWLAAGAGWLPVAPTVDAMRILLFEAPAGMDLRTAVMRLAITTVGLLPFVFLAYRYSARAVLIDGSLSHY